MGFKRILPLLFALGLAASVLTGSGEKSPASEAQPPASHIFFQGQRAVVEQLGIVFVKTEQTTGSLPLPEGYHVLTCWFSVENMGKAEETVRYDSFFCSAGGTACQQYLDGKAGSGFRLPGNKTVHTKLTFAVPDGAASVRIAYAARPRALSPWFVIQ